MQKHTYELSLSELRRLKRDITDIGYIIKSNEFLEFIAKKCIAKLRQISQFKLSDSALSNKEQSAYMQNHKYIVHNGVITLYNDSQIDVASKTWMSDATRANYKAELSLSKVIEYGIGYTGGLGAYSYSEDNWQYDVNSHGYKGWYYEDETGNKCWTNGFYGKQIYATLMDIIDELIPKWIDEYINKKL